MLSQETVECSESTHSFAIANPSFGRGSIRGDGSQPVSSQDQLHMTVEQATALFAVNVDDNKECTESERHHISTRWQKRDGRDECTVSSSSTTSTMSTDSTEATCFSSDDDSNSCRSLFSSVASVEEASRGVVRRKRTRSSSCGSPCVLCTPAKNARAPTPVRAVAKAPDIGDRLLLSEEGCASSSVSEAAPDPLGSLSDEQLLAFHQVVREGRSVFITGGAGTGKSYLLRQIIASLPRATTFVTATTGLAAMNLSGTTLHRFAGCGLVEPWSDRKEVLSKMQASQRCRAAWRACHTLVIDEVSMLDAWFFDLLEYAARRIRQRPNDPFGGIQLVLSGDFLQLPPVVKQRRHTKPAFCFESEAWLRVNLQICLLTKPFRQKNAFFFRLLNQIRFGQMDTESLTFLASLSARTAVGPPPRNLDRERHFNPHDRIQAMGDPSSSLIPSRPLLPNLSDAMSLRAFDGYTLLRSKRTEVDRENAHHFRQLDTEVFMYRGFHTGQGEFPSQNIQEVVELRVGCRVMLIKNHDTVNSLVNGSTGTVTGFLDIARGYALSGSSLTREEVLRLCCGRGEDTGRRHTKLPIVKFDTSYPSGDQSSSSPPALLEIVVEPRAWVEMSGKTVLSSTVQLPLILSYAITIHKSQGMSLTKVDIDLKNCFEAGQAYVALSRCTDFNYVHLGAFDMRVVTPNITALAYYKALELDHRRQGRAPLKGGDASGGDGETAVSNASTRLDALRRGIMPNLELAAQVRRLTMQRVQPAEAVRNAKLVMDVSAFFNLIITSGSVLKYDLIFGQNGNMMRLPDAVRRFLSDVAALPGAHVSLGSASTPPSIPAVAPTGRGGRVEGGVAIPCESGGGGNGASASLCDARNVAAEALVLIQRAKSDFVFDAQSEDQRRPVPGNPLPEWRPYAAVLPLLDPRHPLRTYTIDSSTQLHLTSEGVGGSIACGEGWSPCEESMHSSTLSCDEWGFIFNQHPREILLCREILEYSIYLRERYGPSVSVCTDSLTLASYSMAFGLQVVSMGFLASSSSSNVQCKS
ncbi:unnamed protein product [Phytomonas sp. EM1]|nr:unnamed protein product [Phytomonas sp. EM1]|eukprot:CCW65383.1 unnamed protein product [Phytomonas sp. isolate EM1]